MVDTVNVAVLLPAGTVTLAGTEATDRLLLDSATTAPPAGAGLFKVTVPPEEPPPTTMAGFKLTTARAAGTGEGSAQHSDLSR